MRTKGTEAGPGLCGPQPRDHRRHGPQTGFVKAAGPCAAACPGVLAAQQGEIKAEEM